MDRANKKMCGVQKSLINTTIQTDVLDEFKDNCERLKVPMNYIIERFMEKFNNGDFKLTIGDGRIKKSDIEVDFKK